MRRMFKKPIVFVFDLRHWVDRLGDRLDLGPYGTRHLHQGMSEDDFIVCPKQEVHSLKEMLAYYRSIRFTVPRDENIILIDSVTSNKTEMPAVLLKSENQEAYNRVLNVVRSGGRVEGFEATEAFDELIFKLQSDCGRDDVSLTPLREVSNRHGDKLNSRDTASELGIPGYLPYERLPEWITNAHEAAEWFMKWGMDKKCRFVVKDPCGASGLGNLVRPNLPHDQCIEKIVEFLERCDWLERRAEGTSMFVEEFFANHIPVSFTFYLKRGVAPHLIGATLQIQSKEKPDSGYDVHEGNVATGSLPELLSPSVPSSIRERIHEDCTALLAPFLADMLEHGFEGYMGSDLMIQLEQCTDTGEWSYTVRIAEFNMRCTGSVPASATHDQVDSARNGRATVIAAMNTKFGREVTLKQLVSELSDLAYAPQTGIGIVICMAPGLPGKCILQDVEGSFHDAVALLTDARKRLEAVPTQVIGLNHSGEPVTV